MALWHPGTRVFRNSRGYGTPGCDTGFSAAQAGILYSLELRSPPVLCRSAKSILVAVHALLVLFERERSWLMSLSVHSAPGSRLWIRVIRAIRG